MLPYGSTSADPSKSLIVGTNEESGLYVYDLSGKEVFKFDKCNPTAVDIRYDFPLGNKKVDIVACSDRSFNGIDIFTIDSDGTLKQVKGQPIISSLKEIDGFCLYHDKARDMFYAFLTGESGKGEQYRLYSTPEGKVNGELSRMFSVQSKAEACIADDELGYLYISEAKEGVWRCPASPDERVIRVLIGGDGHFNLKSEIQGLAIYYAPDGKGYLIASSKGNKSFAVFERNNPNKYLGSFSIGKADNSGELTNTYGIAVSGHDLGPLFPKGLFIAQDIYQQDSTAGYNQNFELVDWNKIAASFNPPLLSEIK